MKPGFILRALIGSAAWGAVLLFSAGTSRWLCAWLYIAGSLVLHLSFSHLLHRNAPDVAVERSRVPFEKDQPMADRVVLGFMMLARAGLLMVAGLDKRLGWSDVPAEIQLIGAAFVAATYYTTYRIALENKFAAAVIKIQRARGHGVVDTGPYRYVRHPMYTGLILRTLGAPLLLGSWWGLCPAAILIALVVVRLLFEERTLSSGLEGYDRYIERVPYRLIPLVW
jgi:protein-S-isoprenylcysteine O-methyltransferase Ste14